MYLFVYYLILENICTLLFSMHESVLFLTTKSCSKALFLPLCNTILFVSVGHWDWWEGKEEICSTSLTQCHISEQMHFAINLFAKIGNYGFAFLLFPFFFFFICLCLLWTISKEVGDELEKCIWKPFLLQDHACHYQQSCVLTTTSCHHSSFYVLRHTLHEH